MTEPPVILIVEDEVAIRELVASIAEARAALSKVRPDLILLDLMLPDMSGLEWLRGFPQEPNAAGIPVIMLTARGDEMDRVAGLDAGADDYVVKPFLPRELTARIRAVLRRHAAGRDVAPQASQTSQTHGEPEEAEEAEKIVRCGPLVMNEARFEALVDGKPLKLSAKEFKLLYLFASKPGRVFSRENLLSAVWQSAFVDERTVDVHMLRLRKALAGTAAENLIETVRGVGYRCRAED